MEISFPAVKHESNAIFVPDYTFSHRSTGIEPTVRDAHFHWNQTIHSK